MRTSSIQRTILVLALAVASSEAAAAEPAAENIPNRPRVPGVLRMRMQERRETAVGSGQFNVVERIADWNVAETAIIICDMWDNHWCQSCAQRVGVMVPRMNQVVTAARSRGVMIIHAPSDTMSKYADMPQRKRMQQAKPATPPVPLLARCPLDTAKEPPLPIDVSKCDCDDPQPGPEGNLHTREHPGLDITGYDGISDRGQEIFNFCEQEGIKNIVIMGVHTNYCILARSFGIRQLVRLGKNVVLVRDLTDAMYDPRQPPYVSQARGTELVIEHIEKYWCPSILAADLTQVALGSDDPAGKGQEPLVVELWPGKVPGDVGIDGEEKSFELKVGGKPYEVGGKPTRWLTNVTKPTLTVYRPAKDQDTGVAMLICPGGGYHNLGWDVEGEEVAAWLNSLGMTGIILKYRCPRRAGDTKGEPPLGPLRDAQRAVSLVRSKAREWGIDPAKIGMVGFSAGGHLVGATATNFEHRTYESVDDIDSVSCRPDFAVMLYSGYFKVKDKDELSPTIHVTASAPPLFFVHATDDPISAVDHSVTMYLAMKRAGAAAEMHIYATGGHGFGVRSVDHPCASWTERCTDWLRKQGILNTAPRP